MELADSPTLRALNEQDSLEELTLLLHRSYRELADRGLRFVATHQSVETTRQRCASGHTTVAVMNGKIVGTITLYGKDMTGGCEFYDLPGVGHFGQFGVDPDWKHKGIGKLLMNHVEEQALQMGLEELALDTSDQATHLIELYKRWGYRLVGTARWDEVNYSSVIMSKRLV